MEKINEVRLFESLNRELERTGLWLAYGKYYTDNSMRLGMQRLGGMILRPKRFEWGAEYEQVLRWVLGNEGRSLCMMGNCGTGKTLMLNLLSYMITTATRTIPHGMDCLGGTGWKVIQVYPSESINSTDAMTSNVMGTRNVLFLDDIGREPKKMYYGNLIDRFPEIVDRIARCGGTLVFTTNLTGEQLRERYGERTTDRLRGMCEFVTFGGESKR